MIGETSLRELDEQTGCLEEHQVALQIVGNGVCERKHTLRSRRTVETEDEL